MGITLFTGSETLDHLNWDSCMYSHTGRNKQCERKTNTCFYSFSMQNLNTSQTGTYIDIERYASSVLDYISTSIDSVTTQKQITMYPNQKPWMNRDVRLLLKARNIAFRSGDAQTYSTARANLKRGIKKAKHDYKLKVEGHFSNSNPRSMWQGIQVISNYKPINPSPPSTDISFLIELNNFYARFEKDNQEQASKVELTAGHQPLTFSTTDVRAELSRINPRKAAGPDGIPGRVLRTCAAELAGVLTDLFNLSLAHAVVPTCFKSTSIVPVPKHSTPACLNDYRPVALTPIITKCLEQLVLAQLKSCLPPNPGPLSSHSWTIKTHTPECCS
ncbi:hypothetical protein D4764_0197160 [Takifugu flavidus]|uniref:RNA-directed DNA polymerase from transposon X-element n=1 Tax=Takifugu flavidus TaxID=433684 RepID=A0A5C6MKK2_9TELE|nr:hypothetical protein D4764_0197160 [Takifugu flavidus]